MGVSMNNLGGLGPNVDNENEQASQYIRLTNVMHAQTSDGESILVDLDVKNTSHYEPVNTENNGVESSMGSINIVSGTHVDLNFTFIDHATGKPVVVKRAVITVMDVDTGRLDKQGKARDQESVTVEGSYAYYVTNNTKVGVITLQDNRLFAVALERGTGLDNPDSPLDMLDDAQDRSIAFEFHNRSSFKLTMAVANGGSHANGKKGRNFMLAGYSILTMESTVAKIAYTKTPPNVDESLGRGLGFDPVPADGA